MKKHSALASIVALGATVALALSGCSANTSNESASGGATEDDIISVAFGFIPDYNGTSLLAIAEDQGYWEKYNLEVETPSFTNGPLQIQALGTGDLDFGYIGPGAFWLPASGEAKIVAINTLGRPTVLSPSPASTASKTSRARRSPSPRGPRET